MDPMSRRRRLGEGFTLIEIMVVILILGLLATIVVQSLRGATDKAKRTKAEADISEIKTAPSSPVSSSMSFSNATCSRIRC